MTTLSDLLRDADPLRDERRPSGSRERVRDVVLSAPRGTSPRRLPIPGRLFISVALLLAAAAGVKFVWLHAPPNAVSAVRFEARLAAAQESIVDNRDIRTARVVPGATPTTFAVALTFTDDGSEKMRRATEAHLGEQLELLVDGDVVVAPTIRAAISSSAMLTGDYTFEQASRIVEGLMQGKLEVRSKN
jgi:hypothetical protein